MDDIRFEWEEAKDLANQDKHGVSEAMLAFADEYGILLADPDHSDAEDRFVLLGRCVVGLLVVCHCYRVGVVRIISARKATRRELAAYVRGLN